MDADFLEFGSRRVAMRQAFRKDALDLLERAPQHMRLPVPDPEPD